MDNKISEAFLKVKDDMNFLRERIDKLTVNQEFMVKELMRLKEAVEKPKAVSVKKPVKKKVSKKVKKKVLKRK